MLKKIFVSFVLALQNIKSNFFHTVLSVLGIVIGVAALVAILSLIDGMEKFAHEQISNTTSLEALVIQPVLYEQVDGVRMKKEKYAYVNYQQFETLQETLKESAEGFMLLTKSKRISVKGSDAQHGIHLSGVTENIGDAVVVVKGEGFSKEDISSGAHAIVLTDVLAAKLVQGDSSISLIGSVVVVDGKDFLVKGIIKADGKGARAAIPITAFGLQTLKEEPAQMIFKAKSVELVPVIKERINNWLAEHFPNNIGDFEVQTNELRVEQANKGFLVFRIVMGLIVGISVVVGGIGVMNVLLISVNERTSEIGVRKAAGAKKRDILLQFLSESVAISALGSFIGLIFGILATMVIVPIVRSITKMSFDAAYTANTLIIITIVALLVGIIFGTYPALRASRLNPVEAIRRE